MLLTWAFLRIRAGDLVSHAARHLRGFYALLNKTLFSWIVSYAIHPLHICGLLLLWAVMLVGGQWPSLELVLGNYTNGISALVACILLMRQMEHHAHQRKSLDDLHAKVDAITPHTGHPKRKAQP